jgi:hypothetical protein
MLPNLENKKLKKIIIKKIKINKKEIKKESLMKKINKKIKK